jgi:hypothetical protein
MLIDIIFFSFASMRVYTCTVLRWMTCIKQYCFIFVGSCGACPRMFSGLGCWFLLCSYRRWLEKCPYQPCHWARGCLPHCLLEGWTLWRVPLVAVCLHGEWFWCPMTTVHCRCAPALWRPVSRCCSHAAVSGAGQRCWCPASVDLLIQHCNSADVPSVSSVLPVTVIQ